MPSTAPAVSRTSSPLYRRLAEVLSEEIANGRPALGDALPAEGDLALRFAASRHTVRAAIDVLHERGLVMRRNGARTRVIAVRPRETFTQSVATLSQLMNYPSDTYRENVGSEHLVADEGLSAVLGCVPGTSWLRIRALRRSPRFARPLCWNEIYLLPEYARVLKLPDHERTHVYEQVHRLFGRAVERAQIDMFAGTVSDSIAAPLEVAPGTATLNVVRRYLDRDSKLFEASLTIHPQGRYMFSLEFAKDSV
jgi:GntR family transcriptional regulator